MSTVKLQEKLRQTSSLQQSQVFLNGEWERYLKQICLNMPLRILNTSGGDSTMNTEFEALLPSIWPHRLHLQLSVWCLPSMHSVLPQGQWNSVCSKTWRSYLLIYWAPLEGSPSEVEPFKPPTTGLVVGHGF